MKIVRKIRSNLMAALVVTCLGLMWGLAPALAGTYQDYALSLTRNLPGDAKFRPDLEANLADLANAYRASKGKDALAASDLFLTAARAHAADMMLNNFMGHTASTGHNFDSRMRVFAGDITRFPAMGENAARQSQKTPVNAAKAQSLFQQWVKSGSHRRTLVSRDYGFVSTGVVQRGTTIWAVQIFWAAPREKGLFQ